MTFTPLKEALASQIEGANDSLTYITKNLHKQARKKEKSVGRLIKS